MYRFIKTLAPLVLVVFFSTAVVGVGWGKEGDISAKVDIPGGVDQGSTFEIKASFYREDASGAKNLILENNAIKLKLPEGFNVQSDSISSTVEGQHIYQIVVPMVEGEFPITLIFDNQKEAPTKFDYKINVINPGTYYIQAVMIFGIVIGVGLLVATILNTFSQNWKGNF